MKWIVIVVCGALALGSIILKKVFSSESSSTPISDEGVERLAKYVWESTYNPHNL